MVKSELTKSINFAGVAACGLLVCTVMTFTPAEAADTVDFTKLSGTWSGTETLYQVLSRPPLKVDGDPGSLSTRC